MAARYGHLINKWTVAAVAALALMAVVLATALPAWAQTTGQCVTVGNNLECTYAENGEGRVHDFHATDPDRGGVVIWELVTATGEGELGQGYPDHDDFEIDRQTGVLTFKNPPNFEMAMDDGGNNVYMVKVQAGDGEKTFKLVGVTVRVTNKEETGAMTLKNLQPQVRTDLGYNEPVDDDGSVNVSVQQWSRSRSMTSGYTNITGATSETYSPKNEDIGYYLRVTVTYVDGAGEGTDTAMASSMYRVWAQPDKDNTGPMFLDEDGDGSDSAPSGEDGTGATAAREIDENTPAGMNVGPPVVATDKDLDVLTYSLTGTDMDRFSIDQVTGQIMTKVKLNAEAGVGDADGCVTVTACSVNIMATDPSGGIVGITVTITVNGLNEAPMLAGALVISHPEPVDDTLVALDINLNDTSPNPATYTATDTDTGDTPGLDVLGPDASKFSIDAGTLAFNANPDFEVPGDKNKDNIYEVTVVARDSMWATAMKDVTIKVTNVEEDGSVKLSHTNPEVETALMATLSDPDGGETGVKWQWHRLDSADDPLTDGNAISGKRSARYVPVTADDTKFLAAKATYTDKVRNVEEDDPSIFSNEPEMIFDVSDNAVRAKVSNNPLPKFIEDGDGTGETKTYMRYVQEEQNPNADVVLNSDGTTTDPNNDNVVATDTSADDVVDPLVYTLGGADKAYFNLSADAAILTTKKKLDYETKKRHTVTVTATDPSGGKATVTVTINVVDDPEAPKITGPERIEYMENGTPAVETYMAKDPEGKSIVWALDETSEADDDEDFKVTQKSGGSTMLAFKKSPNYEMSTGGGSADSAIGKIYTVNLVATVVGTTGTCSPDANVACAEREVMVRVTDVEEAPKFSKSTATLSVKETTPMSDNAEATTGPNADIGTEMAKDGDNDAVTYSLGGRDAGSFNIIPATGEIIRKDPLDYETKNMYRVTVTATDPSGLDDTIAITIEVLDVPEEPTITEGGISISGLSTVENYTENGTDAVATYEAQGENAARARWSLEGADSGDFRLDGTGMSRMLKFRSSPNYEMAMDADTDNTYMVTVKASHGSGDEMVMDTQDVTVTVTDVDEDGMVTLSPTTPVVDAMLTATLTDPDGSVTGETWMWSRSMTMGGTFENIDGATSMSYTPMAADKGYYLRATATYTDKHGSQEEMATTTAAVTAGDPLVIRYDTDPQNGMIDRSEVIAAIRDYLDGEVGAPSRANVIQLIRLYLDG